MNARSIFLTIGLLAPLATLHATPPSLEKAGETQIQPARVEAAGQLPVTPGAKQGVENADRVLGATVEPVPRLVAVHLPALLAPNQGLLVTDVAPYSPCAAAGIAPDDILHSCNAVPLLDSRQLRERCDGDNGEPLVLGVIRRGVLYIAKLTRQAPADASPAPAPAAAESSAARATTTARSVVIRCDDGQIAIASTDGAAFEVRVVTPDGAEHHFAGSPEAILGQIGNLPERLRTYIERALHDRDPRGAEESESPSRRGARASGKSRP